MNHNLSAPVPFLTINGKHFKVGEFLPVHDHIPYLCEVTQQLVKLRYSEFYKSWSIYANDDYYIMTDKLERPIEMEDKKIETYLTEEQDRKLGDFIMQGLLEDEKKRRSQGLNY